MNGITEKIEMKNGNNLRRERIKNQTFKWDVFADTFFERNSVYRDK